MFEFDQDAVDALLVDSAQFRRLYDKYSTLKTQVQDAHARLVVMDDLKLESLKKEKLQLKDRMAVMIKDYRHIQV
ncbi:MAG: YdcH family protein [Gammaproteobacteria bacterium]